MDNQHEQKWSQPIRQFRGWLWIVVTCLTVTMSLFHLYTAGFGLFTSLIQRGVHLAFALCLIFLLYRATRHASLDRLPVYDVVLSIMGFVVGAYVVVNYDQILMNEGTITRLEVVFGVIAILLILEAVRRTLGLSMVILTSLFLMYAFLGPHIPGVLGHRGYSLDRVAYHLYLTTNGIFSIPFGTSATIIAMFILFSTFLDKTGAGKTFMDLAFGMTGRFRGGPAKAAVIGSSIMGTVTGAAVSNVVTTGSFTIPLMKRTGFSPRFAGAVEAVSSTGGQIMPPVMGAAVFIMADYTQMSYVDICIAAILPAFLYYVSIFLMVHFEAVKRKMKGLTREELPSMRTTILSGFHLIIPLILLIALLFARYSPIYAVFYSLLLLIVLSMLRKSSRLSFRSIIEALDQGAKLVLNIASACAAAGIIIGVLTLTGLATKFGSMLVMLSGGNLIILLLLTMLASIVLGMGLPIAPCYVLLAALVVPALIDAGVPLLAAHLFVFYFGMISTITPPIALAAYAAAGIARANPNAVGFMALKIGIVAYIVPFMFVFSPELLMNGSIDVILQVIVTSVLGCLALACGVIGHMIARCTWVERMMLMLASLLLIYSTLVTDTIGLLLLLAVVLFQWKTNQKRLRADFPAHQA